MATKKRKTTDWAPGTWERHYRGVFVWVEEMFTCAPRWQWSTAGDLEGREKTKLAAMRAAERAVDEEIEANS